MRKAERYAGVIGWFSENMPVAETELHFDSTFQLLFDKFSESFIIDRFIFVHRCYQCCHCTT